MPDMTWKPPATGGIRWGIIGCGDVTEVKSGPAFNRVPDSRLVAVMRRDAVKAADYARRHGVPRWYDDAAALVADPEVDAVYVATPPGAHEAGCRLAAAAGKPVYIEKPMARTAGECRRMIEVCAAAGVPLFVAYYRRALPRFVRLRELVRSGAIGRPTAVAIRFAQSRLGSDPAREWRLRPEQAGGGIFIDLASHALDIVDFICGPLSQVSAQAGHRGSPSPAEDGVNLVFRCPDGVLGSGTWDFCAGIDEDLLSITGTRGRLSVPVYGEAPIIGEGRGRDRERWDIPHPPHIQEPMIASVVDALLGRGTCVSTGESALRTAAVMDAALDAYYGGRDDGCWTRPWPGLGGAVS
jgi:1,5-anhydro-D-fructose reductase (1,5-anhydro-D-mannitol-forming)